MGARGAALHARGRAPPPTLDTSSAGAAGVGRPVTVADGTPGGL